MDSKKERGQLTFTIPNGTIFTIGDSIVQVESISRTQLKVRVNAPKSIRISRHAEGKSIQQKSTDTP